MFQPQPTPYAHFIPYGLSHVPSPGIPEYVFAPTHLLDQYGSRVGGRHGRGQAGVGSGGDGTLAGAIGVPVGHGGLSVRGGASPSPSPSAPASASARVFAGAVAADDFDGTAALGAGAGAGSGTTTGAIRGLGHGSSTPSTTAVTSASGNSAGYSGSNGGGGTTNSVHLDSYNLNLPISVPARRHNQHNRHHNHPDRCQQSNHQPQSQHQHQFHHLSLPHNSTIGERDHTSITTTGSLLSYEMSQQSELEQADLAQQEAATTDFTPQLEGALVGDKVPTQIITDQYAGADPVFVAKTLALPQTYPHYRPILGDGNCGWRAIAFAYLEVLVRSGDVNVVQAELQRIISLNRYIETVGGQDPTIFEDMVTETVDVFNDIIAAMSGGNDPMPVLMVKFNDIDVAPYLVYHLRLLAQTKMKEDPAQYAAWVDDDVEGYIRSTIMPVDKEIDHICLALLHEVLLKPANIVLEIAYLDRSEGAEVNVHRMPEEANGQDPSTLGSVITLLYRPGHYDILYRDLPVHASPGAAVPVPVDIQVNRATFESTQFHHIPAIQGDFSIDMSAMAMIPGLVPEPLSVSPFAPPSTTPSPADQYAPSPASSWVPQHYTHDALSAPSPSQPSPPHQQATVHQLRFSKYNFPNLPEMKTESNNNYEPAYSTPTFKNSHFNTAHFSNMNFQPEIYKPEADEEGSASGHGKSRRKRSSDYGSGLKKEK